MVKWIFNSAILAFGSKDDIDFKPDIERNVFNILTRHFSKMDPLWFYYYKPKLNHVIVIHEHKK